MAESTLARVRDWLVKMKQVEGYQAHLRGCKCRELDPEVCAKLDIGEYATFTDEHCTCGLTAALADVPDNAHAGCPTCYERCSDRPVGEPCPCGCHPPVEREFLKAERTEPT